MYVGYNCFIIFNSKEIYGPFKPTQASPSDPTMPSAHAEVVAIKTVFSLKKKFKNATLALIRWGYHKNEDDWRLADGVPCEDCVKFIEKFNVKKFIISSSTDELIEVDLDYLKEKTKKSSGRLYGR